MGTSQEGTIGSVERAIEIVDYLRDTDTATVTEIAGAVDCAKSTAHRHLETLLEKECVVRDGQEYALGLKFLEHGERARSRNSAYALAAEKVRAVAEETDERAQFIVEEHGLGVYVHRATGENAVDVNTHLGKRVPLHASAAGLSILSEFPSERVDDIVADRGLPALTDETITDPESLREELELVRERGYSVNDQGFVSGLRAVGVPITGADGEVVGGLSVAGPINRFREDRLHGELPSLLRGVANELELKITYE